MANDVAWVKVALSVSDYAVDSPKTRELEFPEVFPACVAPL